MNQFLFTDGTNGVKELSSAGELQQCIRAATDQAAVRIWVFPSNAWMTCAEFIKQYPVFGEPVKASPATVEKTISRNGLTGVKKKKSFPVGQFILFLLLVAGTLLIFNFTRPRWESAGPLTVQAARPGNVPLMDMDSLYADIEAKRGQRIDKHTKNNLRLRNTWPEKILLRVSANREQSQAGNKYDHIVVTADNTTGYPVDRAVARFTVWKQDKVIVSDTVMFNAMPFSGAMERAITGVFRGDSISVHFETIEARAFNFCYASGLENKSGNYNDRWFCRE